MTGIDALVVAPRRIAAAGREIEIRPLKIVDTPRFTRALKTVWAYVAEDRMVDALEKDYDAAVDLVAVGAGLDRDQVDALDQAEYLALLTVVFEVNLDFFVRRVRPEMERMAAVLSDAMATGAGATSSPGSSSGATAAPIA